MGADAPIPPYDRCRRPRGALPRRLQFPVFPETDIAPPCRTEALRRGALPISSIYKIFMVFGANTLFTLISPERKTTHSRKCPDRKQPFSGIKRRSRTPAEENYRRRITRRAIPRATAHSTVAGPDGDSSGVGSNVPSGVSLSVTFLLVVTVFIGVPEAPVMTGVEPAESCVSGAKKWTRLPRRMVTLAL